MKSAFDVLEERGFIKQLSHPEIKDKIEKDKLSFYIGYDPTADSLHVGHFVQLMAMSHMQRAGHKPIVLIGGGTCMIGDPSGKTDMRTMMTREQIKANGEKMKKQMERFLDFGPNGAVMDDNADWLLGLNYVDFLREVGVHFSVNRMLSAECYKQRLERGLTFFEFNYMLMQSYDFLYLYRKYGCTLQLGGDDQWSNILAGADLIRRKEGAEAFAMTFALLTTSDGVKMGKTVKGALWLDPEKTSPYEFYQYWRNVEDASIEKCLALLTYIPMEEIRKIMQGDVNAAKKRLAFEVTKLIHGEAEAKKAEDASNALFGGGGDISNMPTTVVDSENEVTVAELMVMGKLAKSKSDARRLIEGGGVLVNEEKTTDVFASVTKEMLDCGIIIKRGKKNFHRFIAK